MTGDPTYGLPTQQCSTSYNRAANTDHNQTLAAPFIKHACYKRRRTVRVEIRRLEEVSFDTAISSVNVRKNETVWKLEICCHIRMLKSLKDGRTTQGQQIQHLLAALRLTCFAMAAIDTKDVKAADNWTYTFNDLTIVI